MGALAASTPAQFRFSVKVPKTITHTAKLANTGALLQAFLDQAAGLGEKLGPLLIQTTWIIGSPHDGRHEGVTGLILLSLHEE